MIADMHRESLMIIRPLIQQHVIDGKQILIVRPVNTYNYNVWVQSVLFDLNSWLTDVPYGLSVFEYRTEQAAKAAAKPTPYYPKYAYQSSGTARLSGDASMVHDNFIYVYPGGGQIVISGLAITIPSYKPVIQNDREIVIIFTAQIAALQEIYQKINKETVPTGSIVYY